MAKPTGCSVSLPTPNALPPFHLAGRAYDGLPFPPGDGLSGSPGETQTRRGWP
uniref:Uncharacterized protein n=1 Tax=Caudovirales sp. ctrNG92 TaxID=2827638 RepID=A0A8S5SF71_9CAUD|nr:MAG TPA: hypothetical protein [Caudovirales sp. ctrNG92]